MVAQVGVLHMTSKPRRSNTKTVLRLLEIDNDHLTAEERQGGKVMLSEVHRHVIERTDNADVLETLKAAQLRLPRMVWLVYLAMDLGLVTRNRDATGPLVFVQPPHFLNDEEAAAWYGKSARTMRDYYSEARRVVADETTTSRAG